MKNVALSLVAVAGLSAAALAQTNNFTYELRLNPVAGTTVGLEGGTVSFWLEARSRANSLAANNTNYGVLRATTGPAGQSNSSITVTDSVGSTRLARGTVQAAGPGGFALTGRGLLFRSGGPVDDTTADAWHSATENGTGGAAFPSGTGNAYGAFDQGGDRLFGFDAYAGPSRSGATNPWIGDFPTTAVGAFSPWSQLYRIDVVVAAGGERTVNLAASAYLSSGVRAQNIGGGTWLMNLSAASPASGSASATGAITVIPAPGAAAVLGLAGLAAARRRRA